MNKKLIFVTLIGFASLAMLLGFHNFSRNYFQSDQEVLTQTALLQQDETKLDYYILENSLYLYHSFDDIQHTIDKLSQDLLTLKTNTHLPTEHPKSYQLLKSYQQLLQQKIQAIYDFETLNAPIKNSLSFIALYLQQLPTLFDQKQITPQYEELVLKTISLIFTAKNGFDASFLEQIRSNIQKLSHYSFADTILDRLHTLFLSHIKNFATHFPNYTKLLHHITHHKSTQILDKLLHTFLAEAHQQLRTINYIFVALVLFYIILTLFVIALLRKLQTENIILRQLRDKLTHLSQTDPLTKLYNRYMLEEHLTSAKGLVLLNIDRFKHINDFYGTAIGNAILKAVANKLRSLQLDAKLYRIGADDFGVLFFKEANLQETMCFLRKKLSDFYHVGSFDIKLSLSAGASTIPPLLETADIALKTVKKDPYNSCLLYSQKQSEFFEKVKRNIERTQHLEFILAHNKIQLYFQPILNTQTLEPVKYEVLARVPRDGKVESIFPYLDLAKEAKLYEDLTLQIITKSFSMLKKHKKPLSINISIEDIQSTKARNLINDFCKKESNLAKLLTFELLESAAIQNYELLYDFATKIQTFGAALAIDDFGSGYSNFAHILNLNADFLKIDGSLIKNIDSNPNSYLIVETIQSLAAKANIKTVAEFVHSQEVLERVRELGIDFVQGFYIGEPRQNI